MWFFWLFVSNKNSVLTLTPTSNLLTLVHKSDWLKVMLFQEQERHTGQRMWLNIGLSHIVLVVSPECWKCQWSDNEVTEGRVVCVCVCVCVWVCKWIRERRPLKDSIQLMLSVVSAPYLNNSPLHDKDFSLPYKLYIVNKSINNKSLSSFTPYRRSLKLELHAFILSPLN